MERNKHYYVRRKSLLTWLMVLCMTASAVTRFLYVGVKGPYLWSQICLPIGAVLLYVLICLVWGKEYFYKTAIPMWLVHLYYFFYFYSLDFGPIEGMTTFLYGAVLIFLSIFYVQVTSGRVKPGWLLFFAQPIPLICRLYISRGHILDMDWAGLLPIVPDALMTIGFLCILLGLQVHPVDEYHPTWGDRIDGRRIRTEPPMNQFAPYVMDTRTGSCNYFSEAIEISAAERYIRQKRREGLTNFGLTHILLASYCRTVAKYPGANRFISGQKLYTHGQDIQFCMMIKKEMSVTSPETLVKLHLTPSDTIDEIYYKMQDEVEKLKDAPLNSEFDKTAQWLMMIPGVLLKSTVWLMRTLDYVGLLPKFMLEVSPFHGSVFFTSMGSLGIPPVFHHLYNFGNLPAFISFGCKRRESSLNDEGIMVQKKYIDINFSLDDRIVDGFYYASYFKHFKRLFRHPEQMELPPEEIVKDIP